MSVMQRKRPLNSETENHVTQFMSGYLTFDDQQMFNHRRQVVKSLVSPNVYQDRQVFKVDKYHKVKQLSLQGTYVDNIIVPIKIAQQQLTVKVFATQTLNFANQSGKNALKVFTVTYDGQSHKITAVTDDGNFNLSADSSAF